MKYRLGLIFIGICCVILGIILGHDVAKADIPPVCQIAYIAENSGNGPNYPIKVCNSGSAVFRNPGAGHHWLLIVDGGTLPEHNQRIPTIMIAEVK